MATQKRLVERNKKICELHKQGFTQREIAEQMNCSDSVVGQVLRDNNLGGTSERGFILAHLPKGDGEIKRKLYQKKADAVANTVKEWSGGKYEYVGGYTNTSGMVTIRCKNCGTEINRSFVPMRHGRKAMPCAVCLEREKRLEAEAKAKAKADKEAQRQKAVNLRKHPCAVCGNITIRPKYCSDACFRKAQNHRSEINKRAKLKHAYTGENISLHELFIRDNGVCYLCGGECKWSDYVQRGDAFIAGNDYPSVDHVIPLTKGGLHAWNNVRLAHRHCNTIKSDKLIPSHS